MVYVEYDKQIFLLPSQFCRKAMERKTSGMVRKSTKDNISTHNISLSFAAKN